MNPALESFHTEIRRGTLVVLVATVALLLMTWGAALLGLPHAVVSLRSATMAIGLCTGVMLSLLLASSAACWVCRIRR